jgi:hypothetical protein
MDSFFFGPLFINIDFIIKINTLYEYLPKQQNCKFFLIVSFFLLLFNLLLCRNRCFSSKSQILMFFNWFIGWLRIWLLPHYYCSWPINGYQQIWAYRTFRTLRFSTLLALGYLDRCIDRLLPRLLFLTMLRPEPRL